MESEIKLIQSPIIKQNLIEVGKDVDDRLLKLNINGQVATEETVKALKDLRASLNKELASYESQRKAVKESVLNPYTEFENLYKEQVSDKYKNAINTLKDKIAVVEDNIKAEKYKNIKTYFDELCLSEKIDFIPFEKTGIEVNLSTSEKKYKEQINTAIQKVISDLALIETQPYKTEILVEYKSTLNVSKSITDVSARKEAERIEAEREKLAEVNRRKNLLLERDFIYADFTKTYEYSTNIYISESEIESLSKEDFTKKLLQFEQSIVALKDSQRIEAEKNNPPVEKADAEHPTNPAVAVSVPIEAPIANEAPKLVSASFEVVGTMVQLRALGQYMKDNNIKYKNI